jgi:hypothetical protein
LFLDPFAQRDHVVVDHPIGNGETCTTDLVEQAFPSEQAAAVADECRQRLEFRCRRLYLLAVAAQLKTRQIQIASTKTLNLVSIARVSVLSRRSRRAA